MVSQIFYPAEQKPKKQTLYILRQSIPRKSGVSQNSYDRPSNHLLSRFTTTRHAGVLRHRNCQIQFFVLSGQVLVSNAHFWNLSTLGNDKIINRIIPKQMWSIHRRNADLCWFLRYKHSLCETKTFRSF